MCVKTLQLERLFRLDRRVFQQQYCLQIKLLASVQFIRNFHSCISYKQAKLITATTFYLLVLSPSLTKDS